MKNLQLCKWLVAFAICGMTLLTTTNNASAQTKVGLVDIGAVFKSHSVFTAQLEQLRQEAERFKASSVQLQQSLIQKAEGIKQYTPGSAEFKQAETALAQESAAMEVEQRDKMRKLMQQEAQLHFRTYSEVNELIGSYCDQQGIQLVLRFNGEPMNPKNPGSIMQRVNGSIIYHDQERDITPQIIAQLAQLKGTANSSNGAQRR